MAFKIRFSLRNLLLSVVVLSLILGFWMNRVHKVRMAIDEIHRLGGTVGFSDHYDENGEALYGPFDGGDLANQRSSMIEWLGPELLYDVVYVDLDGSSATDEDIKILKSLPIRALYVRRTQITDGALVHLKQIPSLRHLGIDDTKVTESGFLELQNEIPQLQTRRDFEFDRIIKVLEDFAIESKQNGVWPKKVDP